MAVIYGTAEAVPFLKDCVLTQTLKAALIYSCYVRAEGRTLQKCGGSTLSEERQALQLAAFGSLSKERRIAAATAITVPAIWCVVRRSFRKITAITTVSMG